MKILTRFRAILLLLLAFSLSCAPSSGPEALVDRPPRHVLLITVDTLRADHLGLYGYARDTTPFLDQRAPTALVFERAIAQWPKTGTSFASFFTGQYPLTSGLTHRASIRIPEAYLTLPEFMKDQGFTTLAVVSNAVLSKEKDWHRGFDRFLETWAASSQEEDDPMAFRRWLNAPRVEEMALPLLEEQANAERIFFWLHYSDPHRPYLLPPGETNPFLEDQYYTGETKAEFEPGKRVSTRLGDQDDLKYYVAQYDANIRVVDRSIETFLKKAESLGILEESLVIITADHGESLGEHGYFFGHGRLPYNNAARVPLVVFGAGVQPGRVERPVELIDLYPTLERWVGQEVPVPGLEGDSLLDLFEDPKSAVSTENQRYAFASAGGGRPLTHYRFIQDERFKVVYHPKRKRREAWWEFYDLEKDPEEAHNLVDDPPPETRVLTHALKEWMGDRDWIQPPKEHREEASQETARALKALGYVQ